MHANAVENGTMVRINSDRISSAEHVVRIYTKEENTQQEDVWLIVGDISLNLFDPSLRDAINIRGGYSTRKSKLSCQSSLKTRRAQKQMKHPILYRITFAYKYLMSCSPLFESCLTYA